jgi:hypothetical protein
MFVLDDDELERLTRRKRSREQCQVLKAMGIPYRERPDGSPAVIADAVREAMGVNQRNDQPTINLDAI